MWPIIFGDQKHLQNKKFRYVTEYINKWNTKIPQYPQLILNSVLKLVKVSPATPNEDQERVV